MGGLRLQHSCQWCSNRTVLAYTHVVFILTAVSNFHARNMIVVVHVYQHTCPHHCGCLLYFDAVI